MVVFSWMSTIPSAMRRVSRAQRRVRVLRTMKGAVTPPMVPPMSKNEHWFSGHSELCRKPDVCLNRIYIFLRHSEDAKQM